jgi:hypothetical protein
VIRFSLVVFAISILVVVLAIAAVDNHWIGTLPSFFYPTVILLAFSTILIFKYLYKQEGSQFTKFYLLLMMVKLVAYLAYNLVIVLQDSAGAVGNVLAFLLLYLIYTATEIAFLYRLVNQKGK